MATTSPKDSGSSNLDSDAIKLVIGWVLGLSGIFTAALGLPTEDISLEAMGVLLGIVGYMLGARAIGIATMLISGILMFVVLVLAPSGFAIL